MIRTQCVSWVIAGLCVFGLTSALFAMCNDKSECEDEFRCTLDLCRDGICLHIPVNGFCDNNRYCDGVEACVPLLSRPGTGCMDGPEPCFPLSCAEKTRKCFCTYNADCDDGLYCTGVEACLDGQCVAGIEPDCDDGFSCTDDRCNEQSNMCENIPDNGKCDDGGFCNGAEVCVPETGDSDTGCKDGVRPCDDSDGCTVDTCDGVNRTCSSVYDCSDEFDCTLDTCNTEEKECEHAPNDDACHDGVVCNGVEYCDLNTGCQSPGFNRCDDGLPCTFDACDPVQDVCVHLVDCFDGIACTGAECTTDGCLYTPIDANCDDHIECTLDFCDETTGCRHIPVNYACDDWLFCNGVESCDPSGGCVPGTAPCGGQSCDEATNTCGGVDGPVDLGDEPKDPGPEPEPVPYSPDPD